MPSAVQANLTWDLTPYFPSLDSPEFEESMTTLGVESQELLRAAGTLSVESPASEFERFVPALSTALERASLIRSYIGCLLTTDSYDPGPQRAESRFALAWVSLDQARTLFTAWLGRVGADALIPDSELARAHEYFIVKAGVSASHLMSPDAEAIASELTPSGPSAWSKLYGNVTSQISVEVEGFDTPLPMSAVRALAYSPDRGVRAKAHAAEQESWKRNELVIASALNSVKGTSIALAAKRGWGTPLEVALFNSNIDRATLDAMMGASYDAFPVFRKYLKAKAARLGQPSLAFYDLFAPLPGKELDWGHERGMEFAADQFDRYSPKLGEFARRTYRERWIDFEPRPGKRDGAYCTGTRGDESRVFMNYKDSFGSVSTLAHELGHAYHNVCLADRSRLQRAIPMTLAETASTFCETIVRRAAIANGTEDEKLAVLEASLQGATQVVVDISSRFLFEKWMIEQRATAELAPQELVELMLRAQRETYGDGLSGDAMHGYMWAAKPHYYGSDFYNFPYMFGLLFGLGLYAIYRREPEGFQARYDALLSKTGMADAASLAADFGIDIRSGAFWKGSLDEIAEDVEAFCALTHG